MNQCNALTSDQTIRKMLHRGEGRRATIKPGFYEGRSEEPLLTELFQAPFDCTFRQAVDDWWPEAESAPERSPRRTTKINATMPTNPMAHRMREIVRCLGQ